MIQIVNGDQYILPVKIMQGTTVLTPSNADDVRIQVADTLKTYSKSELTYDSATQEWQYPLSQEQTLTFNEVGVDFQVGVKIGTEISYSCPQKIYVNENIIGRKW